ncbi:MAG: hypothetical protein IJ243_11730 [Prevotella sp.]|nr:hypothetical protein [Prevotella sp.]
MMKRTGKWLIAATLTLLPMAGLAQGKLIWVHSEDEEWRKENPQFVLYDQEKSRLLMPQGAAFGVECVPSFSTEWTLTYDSVACALVYREVEKSLWHATYRALHKLKKIDKKHSKWELRRRPKDYEAPGVKTASLPVSNNQAWMRRGAVEALGPAQAVPAALRHGRARLRRQDSERILRKNRRSFFVSAKKRNKFLCIAPDFS